MKKAMNLYCQLLLLLFVFATVNGCEGPFFETETARQGPEKIMVATVQSPFSIHRHKKEWSGMEHDMLWQFAQDKGYQLSFVSFKSESDALAAVLSGKAHIAAARLTSSSISEDTFTPGPAYDERIPSLVCKKNFNPQKPIEIHASPKLLSYDLRLAFKRSFGKISWISHDTGRTQKLFRLILSKANSCALVDSLEQELFIGFFPSLKLVESPEFEVTYHLAISKQWPALSKEIYSWSQRTARRGELARIKFRYTGHLDELGEFDRMHFFKAVRDRFWEYEAPFKQSAYSHELPWQLIAALAYQESHWNNDATSFTGVKGLMQLTAPTAERLGVEDRTDPQQSISGGTKYLRHLLDLQPQTLPFRERLALALIAYNIGYGHLSDAQELCRRKGKDPYSWKDLKTVLPLLSDPWYASSLKYGAARGNEPVEFVDRVFSYWDLLSQKI